MDNHAKTSVIIITHNRASHLQTCLWSLTVQTLPPSEVVVVDNASTDQTKEIALSFKKSLPLKYVLEKSPGIPFARNKGLKLAVGELILMLDDDCKAQNKWVENMVNYHKIYPKTWAIQGKSFSVPKARIYSILAEFNRFLSIRGHSRQKSFSIFKFLKDTKENFEINTCDTRNISFKTKFIKKHHLRFDENFYRGSDSDFGCQVTARGGQIMFVPKVLVYHWERAKLSHFLEQRWHIGRTAARLEKKWKLKNRNLNSAFLTKMEMLVKFALLKNVWWQLPFLVPLFLLDRLFHLNGWFYEKQIVASVQPKP